MPGNENAQVDVGRMSINILRVLAILGFAITATASVMTAYFVLQHGLASHVDDKAIHLAPDFKTKNGEPVGERHFEMYMVRQENAAASVEKSIADLKNAAVDLSEKIEDAHADDPSYRIRQRRRRENED